MTALIGLGAGCASNGDHRRVDADWPEAVSLEGELLYQPEMEASRREAYLVRLDEAQRRYNADRTSVERIVWYGRRLAYLGRYREAINVFSAGLAIHPDSAELLRHRGHRYITVRRFDEAIADLSRAARLIQGTEDVIEPDGIPNARNMPRSTLHTNIYYHLALAHYLKAEWEPAATAWRACLDASANDDMRIASIYWLQLTRRRMGDNAAADALLSVVSDRMDIIENETYLRLCLLFKTGRLPGQEAESNLGAGIDNATEAYGAGMFRLLRGEREAAIDMFERALDSGAWAAFGAIAAEAELVRLRGVMYRR
ncbi:MAG: hypothetical protein VYC34_03720 [Planctomycetota bacterium]|nr:hypothetical protein [Planctomycetota bacterium]